jgi:APA family basic amino acid/polyamine antiporter
LVDLQDRLSAKELKGEARGYFEVPRLVPALGVLVCLPLIVVRVTTGDWRASAIAGGLLLLCLAVYALVRPKATVERVPSY